MYKRLSLGAGGVTLYPAVEMLIFLAVLLLGLAWAWRKGDLEWA